MFRTIVVVGTRRWTTHIVSVIVRPKRGSVALLIQMTVSGATGLARRPKHSMKQHVLRKKFDSFNVCYAHANPDSAVSAFVVPPECFAPFLFQEETLMDSDDTPTGYQIVLKVDIIFQQLRQSHRDRMMARMPWLSAEAKRKIHKLDDRLRKRPKINYKE